MRHRRHPAEVLGRGVTRRPVDTWEPSGNFNGHLTSGFIAIKNGIL
jgi:hypothetical protein